ncbi:hypothetical protein HII31_07288, partial [Pseudocercospora fuligena]
MSRTSHKPADNKAPLEARINARFAAVKDSIDGIGEAYNQVAEGCTEIAERLEKLEHANEDIRTRLFETRSEVKQVNGVKQKVDSIEFDIKTLINGRLNEHDKAIKDLQSQGSKDVDEVLQSVLLRLQKLEKAPSREKSQSTTASLSTTALAQALLDRLKNGEALENERLAQSLHQTEAAREARARKRKRTSSKSDVPAEDDEGDARSAGTKRSRPLSLRPEADEDVAIDEAFGEGEHRRRSGRAPKPAQLAAGTVSWAEARVLKKQRLGRT